MSPLTNPCIQFPLFYLIAVLNKLEKKGWGIITLFLIKDKVVFFMAALRFLSCIIEFTAAMLFLKFDSIEKALKINAVLALVGPTVMTLVMLLGLAGISSKVPSSKFIIIISGVVLIFWGVSKGR